MQAASLSGYNSRMTALPEWLEPTKRATGLPDWLSERPLRAPSPSKARREVAYAQFEMVLPRILEMVCEGYTLNQAIPELPIEINQGAFMRWLKRRPQDYALYNEAREVRSETWTGLMVKHALGEDTEAELDRSKFIVETLKWIISKQNRKEYGETKTIEVNQNISITAALAQAQGRVIEAQLIEDDEVDLLPSAEYKQLSSGDDGDYEDE